MDKVKKMSRGSTKAFSKWSMLNWASRRCKTTIPGGWVGGWSETDNKANLSPAELKLDWNWAGLSLEKSANLWDCRAEENLDIVHTINHYMDLMNHVEQKQSKCWITWYNKMTIFIFRAVREKECFFIFTAEKNIRKIENYKLVLHKLMMGISLVYLKKSYMLCCKFFQIRMWIILWNLFNSYLRCF